MRNKRTELIQNIAAERNLSLFYKKKLKILSGFDSENFCDS